MDYSTPESIPGRLDRDDDSGQVAITVVDDSGNSTTITVEQALSAVNDNRDKMDGILNESYSVVEEYGGGLVGIDLHPKEMPYFGQSVPLDNVGKDCSLRPGHYFVLYSALTSGFEDSEVEGMDSGSKNGLLLASDYNQAEGELLGCTQAKIGTSYGDGTPVENPPHETIEAWLIRNTETGIYATFFDLLQALATRALTQIALEHYGLDKLGQTGGSIPSITTQPIEKTDFPLDKLNANIWQLLEGAPSGQYGFDFGGEFVAVDEESGLIDVDFNVANRLDRKRGISVPVTYCIDFSDLEESITKKLEPYDKRVCVAVGALFNMGYEVMTLQQIYNAMGNSGKAGKTDKKKIDAILTKLSGAKLHIDNQGEADVYKRTTFVYDGSVVPMERIRAVVNGQVVESAIHVFREPPPISFAKERKQFTTVDVKLLDSPLSKTNGNIQLEDYLIERISWMKRSEGKANNKILFSTLYKHAGISTKKQRLRVADKIEKVLQHYKACGFIDGYSIEKDGVRIFF